MAKRTLCYTARQDILLMQTGAGGSITQIVADVFRQKRRVKMVYLLPSDAARRVVVDDSRTFRLWEPSRRLTIVDQSHEETDEAARRMLELLHRNYRCLLLRPARVNSFPCDLVEIRPRRLARGPCRLLWIARNSHAILRTEEYDTQGYRRYLSFYERYRPSLKLPTGLFTLPRSAETRQANHSTHEVAGFQTAFSDAEVPGRLPAWLPRGFILVGCAVSAPRGGRRTAVLHYSDGLKTVSVFEEVGSSASDSADSPAAVQQPMARYGQQVWAQNYPPLRITIVGDVTLPDSLGMEMLRAVAPGNEAALRRGIIRDFGPASLTLTRVLRRSGWDYTQIAALRMLQRLHPAEAAEIDDRLKRRQSWPELAAGLHAPMDRLEEDARRWIAATLNAN